MGCRPLGTPGSFPPRRRGKPTVYPVDLTSSWPDPVEVTIRVTATDGISTFVDELPEVAMANLRTTA